MRAMKLALAAAFAGVVARAGAEVACPPRLLAAPVERGFDATSQRPFDALMEEAGARMHQGMHEAARSGDPDRDFTAQMIPHHQGAIDMAEALLVHGKDPALRRLAQEIITEQKNEIALMQLWLAQHPRRP